MFRNISVTLHSVSLVQQPKHNMNTNDTFLTDNNHYLALSVARNTLFNILETTPIIICNLFPRENCFLGQKMAFGRPTLRNNFGLTFGCFLLPIIWGPSWLPMRVTWVTLTRLKKNLNAPVKNKLFLHFKEPGRGYGDINYWHILFGHGHLISQENPL